MKYHFRVTKEGEGYVAYCVELNGCQTQADTRKELIPNMKEALNLYLNEPADSKEIFPLPDNKIKGKNIVEIECAVKVAFAMLLRQARLGSKLSQKKVAEKMGYKNTFSYQKLEDSKTANPTLVTISKVKKVFPKLSLERILSP